MDLKPLIDLLLDLTTVLSVLTVVLAGLVLVDCVFLYKRVSLFRRRLNERMEARNDASRSE